MKKNNNKKYIKKYENKHRLYVLILVIIVVADIHFLFLIYYFSDRLKLTVKLEHECIKRS